MIRVNKKDFIFRQANCTMNVLHLPLLKSFVFSICSKDPIKNSTLGILLQDYLQLSASQVPTMMSFFFFFFFSIWVFFHEHSQFTGQQGKGEGIYLTPLYHFHPLHRHLDISRAITAESSPLRIAGSRTRTGNLWFPSTSH